MRISGSGGVPPINPQELIKVQRGPNKVEQPVRDIQLPSHTAARQLMAQKIAESGGPGNLIDIIV